MYNYGSFLLGISDEQNEGSWKFLNGEIFNPNLNNAFTWQDGQPDGGRGENCASVYYNYRNEMLDASCDYDYHYGLCEIKITVVG